MKMDVLCFGHICLDMNPEIPNRINMTGGKLSNIGKMNIHTGGAVANTGLALVRLGVDTALMAGIGDDQLAEMTISLVEGQGGSTQYFKRVSGGTSSYTVVLSPPGVDRMLLHHTGVNDEMVAASVDWDKFAGARLMHFGYPTIMRQFYLNDGEEFVSLMQNAKSHGMVTSADMTLPDPQSESGRVDWRRILERALPYIDIYMPSIEETIYMLDREKFNEMSANGDIISQLNGAYICSIGRQILELGSKVAVLKCGSLGLYAVSSGIKNIQEIADKLGIDAADWSDREVFSSTFHVENVKSAVGAGDTCIAGFLAEMLTGASIESCVNVACAVGALCVMDYSATAGIPRLDEVKKLISGGWSKNALGIDSHLKYSKYSMLYSNT